MKNSIAIVGRTNVGKSLLFNKLTRARKSLVIDYHGVTRDINSGYLLLGNRSLYIEDTGGIPEENDKFSSQILEKASQSITKARLILFVVSAADGLTLQDHEICKMLRKLDREIILLINKTDLSKKSQPISDFYKLGIKDVLLISAKNNTGLSELKDKISLVVTGEEIVEKDIFRRVSIIGKPNAGKSTFFNSLIKENRSIVSSKAGTTRDAISKSIVFKNDKIELFDTAGLRKKSKIDKTIESFSVSKAISSMRSSSGVLYLVDGKENITDQDLHLISLIVSSGKPLILGINKSDKLSQYDKANLTRSINKKLAFVSGISIHHISAKQNKGTAKVFKDLIKLIKKSVKKIDTSKLNDLVEEASKLNPPQMSGRFRPKIKYANLLSSQPTIIRIQGNNLDKLTKQYQKYLENYLRKKMNFEGIPIKLVFKNNSNPFGDRKNKLTKKQLAKRKRIARR